MARQQRAAQQAVGEEGDQQQRHESDGEHGGAELERQAGTRCAGGGGDAGR